MQSLLNKLREENTRSKSLVSQVKSQEVEIKTLLNCVENLRKQMMNNQDVNALDKYGKYDDMMKIYADNKKMIEKMQSCCSGHTSSLLTSQNPTNVDNTPNVLAKGQQPIIELSLSDTSPEQTFTAEEFT